MGEQLWSWLVKALDSEKGTIKAWVFEHEKTCKGYPGASDGKYTVRYTQTGIGDRVDVICGHCNEAKDCSDYEAW